MSLRKNLLLLYGLLLVVLLTALVGFYWAVERSLDDQELLGVARNQLREVESFSTNVRRYLKEAEDSIVLNNSSPKDVGIYHEKAETSIQRLLDHIRDELDILRSRHEDIKQTDRWKLETEERDELLAMQKLFKEMTEASDRLTAHKETMSREDILLALRSIDNKLDHEFAAVVDDMQSSELDETLARERKMLHHSRYFEQIAIGACLATFLIVLGGSLSLFRAFQDLAKKEAAEAADRAKGQFLANMSHEIRTPMTAILGFTHILTQGVKDPEKMEAADIVKRSGEHLLQIINDILDLSKIDAGQLEIERIPCSPWQIVVDTSSLMRVRAIAKGLVLKVEHQGKIPETITSSPIRLRQVLINLIGNAIKFTEMGSVRIVSRFLEENSMMQFDVIDTGIGISPQGMRLLFRPFTQVDGSAVKVSEGTGLGLAISQRLIQLLGGSITVSSVVGQGSKFTVTIPTGPLDGVKMLDSPEEATLQVEAIAEQLVKERPRLNAKILLVEDGPDNQRLISFLLRRAGADVVLAEDGAIAVEKVKQALAAMPASNGEAPFDVILMDMQLPVMDGYQATRELRKMGYNHPIIALTAYAMNTDRDKCLEAGCNDYATKPISEELLLKTIFAQIAVGQQPQAPKTV